MQFHKRVVPTKNKNKIFENFLTLRLSKIILFVPCNAKCFQIYSIACLAIDPLEWIRADPFVSSKRCNAKSPNLFRWRNKLICILDGLWVSECSAKKKFWVNCFLKWEQCAYMYQAEEKCAKTDICFFYFQKSCFLLCYVGLLLC